MEAPRPFSEKMGLVRVVIQTDGMSDALRNSIWNFITRLVEMPGDWHEAHRSVEGLTDAIIGVPVQSIDYGAPLVWLLRHFQNLPWPRVYDALEYIVDRAPTITGRMNVPEAKTAANRILEREYSGFRFIGGELTRVMHPAEAAEVERARATAAAAGLVGVRQHIDQALALFGKRPEPDYRNTIKEAISALEGVVKLIEGVRGGGLKDALDALAKRMEVHGALRDGFIKLYGFTSDEDGIRHPILDEPNVGEEDARFMIVACSAAVNWIIAKADKAGLLKKT